VEVMKSLAQKSRKCAICGVEVPSRAPEGICIACLLDNANEETFPAVVPDGSPSSLRYFGDYEILDEVGHGGMGIVYRARQFGTQRIVALKLLRGGVVAHHDAVQRFHIEARAAATLVHPRIVPVYECGIHESQYFLSMPFLPGGTLAMRITNNGIPPLEAARILLPIAEAVGFAHQRGVLHRDLKPGNILFDETDQPSVADFGLARIAQEETALTLSGAVLGTAAYMAPEQTAGNTTVASDIYSLGAILYELLTGRPPFQKANLAATLRAIIDEQPRRPRELNPSVSLDLETICLKCLEKEPNRRYQSALALAEDLQRFIGHEPISARPISRVTKVIRWSQRNPVLASSLFLSLLMLLLLLVGSPIAAWRINEARKAETAQRKHAEAASYTSDMNVAHQAWGDGDVRRARELLRTHIPKAGEPDLRGFEWRYLWQLFRDESQRTIPLVPAENPAHKTWATPAGDLLATASQDAMRLHDLKSGDERFSFPYPNGGSVVARPLVSISQNANLLAAHWVPGIVALLNVRSGTLLATMGTLAGDLDAIELSPTGRFLAASKGTNVAVWSISPAPHQLWVQSVQLRCHVLRFTPDDRSLVADGRFDSQGQLVAWDTVTGLELAPFPRSEPGYIWTMSFSPDGSILAHSGVSTRISILDFERRSLKRYLDGHSGIVTSLAFSSDGQQLVTGGLDGAIRVWDLASGRVKNLFRDPHESGVWSVAFAPDGKTVVSINQSEMKFWSIAAEPSTLSLANEQSLGAPAISADGRWLLTTSSQPASDSLRAENAKVWDLHTHQHRFSLRPSERQVVSGAFSPNGEMFALGSQGRRIDIWNTRTWKNQTNDALPFTTLTNDYEPGSVSFSRDGKLLAAAGVTFQPESPSITTNRLSFWHVGSWQKLSLLPATEIGSAHSSRAGTVAFSPTANLLAIGTREGWLRVWDYAAGRLAGEWRVFQQKDRVYDVLGVLLAFSPDGHWLLAASMGDRDLVLLDLRRPDLPAQVFPTTEHYRIWSIAFAPENKSVVTAGNDGMIRFWNLDTHNVALALFHGPSHSLRIGLSPDGNLLVSQDAAGRIKFWPAPAIFQGPQLY
jgi:serine/threonine protein kinase/WD40 repeat protein